MKLFLTQKKFWIHLAIIALLIVSLIWITLRALDHFTRHGQSVSVPDFSGLRYDELPDNPEFEKFTFQIIDSIYDIRREKGSIITQDPLPEAKVKEGRMIYLTVVSLNPEKVEMPNLVDLTFRNAKSLLQSYGLSVQNISYVPDIAKNAVIEQHFRGDAIEPGTPIEKGSGIDLVLGLGQQKELIPVPLLIGLTKAEALAKLHSSSLNLGEVHFDSKDTSANRIYNQDPFFTSRSVMKFGGKVDIWLKSEKDFDFEQYLNNLDTTAYELNADTIILNE